MILPVFDGANRPAVSRDMRGRQGIVAALRTLAAISHTREVCQVLGAIVAIAETCPLRSEGVEHLRLALADHADRVLVFGGVGEGGTHRVPLPAAISPLGALAVILRHAGEEHAIVAAADLRHPSSELLRYMVQVRGSFDAVAPERADGSLQPLLALYHPRCARRAAGLVTGGERELSVLLASAHLRRISFDEVAKFGHPTDLLARGE